MRTALVEPRTRRARPLTEAAVRAALGAVVDPELDEPITDLGFVRSIDVAPDGAVEVHLRLPTSFCSPNFAYLMASDSKDAVTAVAGGAAVTVELDDHHDSDLINAGLAADAGYRGTFRHEAEQDLDELRAIFRRKAHVAAMERALSGWLRARPAKGPADTAGVRIGDLDPGPHLEALRRRRAALGLGAAAEDVVLVDERGWPVAEADASLQLRLARSTRISIDGNAHFCRGLLRTRYPDEAVGQTERTDGAEPADAGYARTAFVPVQDLHPKRTKETR